MLDDKVGRFEVIFHRFFFITQVNKISICMFFFLLDDELKLRRFAFIEACAYYIRLKASSGDWNRLVMTTELAELITERYKIYGLDWAIGGLKSYEQLLKDGMQETCKFSMHCILNCFDSVHLIAFGLVEFNCSAGL